MTLLHLSLALAIIAVSYFFGKWDGTEEAEKINDRIARGDNRNLTHWWELTVRVVFLLIGLGAMYLIHLWIGTPQWKLVCVAGMAFGAFVPAHRYFVNTRRTKPMSAWYIAPWGNVYDRIVYSLYFRKLWASRSWLSEAKSLYANNNPTVVECVHEAGRRSYLFEAAVLLASLTTYVLA